MSATPGLQSEDAQGAALAGVGVFMQQDPTDSSCRVFVKTVVPYGPAGLDGRVQVLFVFISIPFIALAGALSQAPQVGDVILSVDSEIVAGMPVSMIRQRILGVAGTFVVLSFLSHSSSKEYTVKLIRGSNDLGIHRSTPPLQSNLSASQFTLQAAKGAPNNSPNEPYNPAAYQPSMTSQFGTAFVPQHSQASMQPGIDTDRTRQILEDCRREWDLERSSLERLLLVERDSRREEQTTRRELERSLAAAQEDIARLKSNISAMKDREERYRLHFNCQFETLSDAKNIEEQCTSCTSLSASGNLSTSERYHKLSARHMNSRPTVKKCTVREATIGGNSVGKPSSDIKKSDAFLQPSRH